MLEDWALFNSYTTNSRGIEVLIKDDFEAEEIIFENVFPSNVSRLTYKMKGEGYLMNCLYTTNEDLTNDYSKKFFEKVFDESYHHATYMNTGIFGL